jgi:transcriptional regulator with XRE-family HTH domain
MAKTDPFDNPKELARTLRDRFGLSKGYASQLANGLRVPSLDLAVRLEDEMKIKPRVWVERHV